MSTTHSSDTSSTSAPSSSPATSTTPSTTAAAATTTSTPTTSASAATATTNGASSASQTSAATTTSGGTTQTTSTPSSTSTQTTSAAVSVVSASGGVFTTTVIEGATPTTTSSQNNSSSSNSFFSNKGAVIAVFTVVGVVVAILVVALVVNALRRRRARKFDRDVAAAAAEAVASSRSPFEDYGYNNNAGGGGGGGGGTGGGGYGYSENSHGTYQMPPMQPNDTFGMTEMSQYDPYAAGAASLAASAAVDRARSRKDSDSGAPGIAGVGARGLAREPSKHAPYHAFAGPAPQPQDLHTSGTIRSQRGIDVLEAAGLAGPDAAVSPINTTNSGAFVTRNPSDTTHHTHFSARSRLSSHHPAMLQPGFAVDSYYPQRTDSLSPDPFAATYPAVTTTVSGPLPNPHEATLPSPIGQQSDQNHSDEDPVSSSTALRGEEQRMSYQDDADYSQGNRVLRVANE